jgi:hypothetical protein
VDGLRHRPLEHHLDLEFIHCGALGGDDVAQVHHGAGAKHALGALDEEAVLQERREDQANVSQMFRPRRAVDRNVVEKYKDKLAYSIHESYS